MNKKIARIAIGYVVILAHEKGVMLQLSTCKIENGGLTATCKPTNKIPSDLDAKLQKLYLTTGSLLDEMNEESFKQYPNILYLNCESVKVKKHITDKFIFRPLTKLQEVHFSQMDLTEASTFFWPESIQILNITNCLAKSLDLTNAVNLRILDANFNSLDDLPIINELAPIEYVNVNFNPLSAVTVSSLARLCHVTHINMYPTPNSNLKSQSHYCACAGILEWVNKFNITSNIRLEDTALECTTPSSGKVTCEIQITPAALKLRDNCLSKKTTDSKWLIIAIIVAIVILLFTLLFFAYMYGWLRKKEELGEVVEIHHGHEAAVEELAAEEELPEGGDDRN